MEGVTVPDWARLLLMTVEHWLLLLAIGAAAAVRAARGGVSDVCLLALSGLAAAGLSGAAAFWIWFVFPPAGRRFSFLLTAGALVYAFWRMPRLEGPARRSLRELAVPVLLVLTVSLAVLAGGFLYGGFEKPLDTPAARFSHPLPSDNWLPFLLAEQILKRHVERPMYIDWLSSDRPPLQSGFTLLQEPFTPKPRDQGYTVLAVILQCLSVFGLWIFLRAFELPKTARALALAVGIGSGLFVVNSFFTWPKLLAAAFALGCGAMFLGDGLYRRMRASNRAAALGGVLAGLSMLSHGGSAFALMGLAVALLLLRRGLPAMRWLAIAAAFLGTYGPWMVYQKYVDPPGDRLLKMHLAGVAKPDPRSFGAVVWSAYRQAGWKETLEARAMNAWAIAGGGGDYWTAVKGLLLSAAQGTPGRAPAERFAAEIRSRQFFFFSQSLGLLVFGPLFLLAGIRKEGRSATWRAAAAGWLAIGCVVLVWWLLMFRPRAAVIHQGSYFASLLAFPASLLAIYAVSKRAALVVASGQLLLTFLVYGAYMEVPGAAPGPHWGMGALAMAACLLLGGLLAFEAGGRGAALPAFLSRRPLRERIR